MPLAQVSGAGHLLGIMLVLAIYKWGHVITISAKQSPTHTQPKIPHHRKTKGKNKRKEKKKKHIHIMKRKIEREVSHRT